MTDIKAPLTDCYPNHPLKFIVLVAVISLFFMASVFAGGISKELRMAAKDGNVEEVRRLLKAGADINKAGKRRGRTPLHIAAKWGHLEAVKHLVSAGAKHNTSSKKGRSPLHHAAIKGKLEVVEFLISVGADVNVISKNGATPLISAASKGHTGIVQVLLANGADISVRTNNGNSAMDRAEKHEHIDTTRVLDIPGLAPGAIIPLKISKEEAQEVFMAATALALKGRGWSITSKKPNRVEGQLKKNKRIFRVVVELTKTRISINFVPYFGFHRQNYLNNLRKDLKRILLPHIG